MIHHQDIVRRIGPHAPLDPHDGDIQSQIGRQLRALYDGVVSQPVPDRFIELLAELEKKTGSAEDGGDKGSGG